MFDGEMVKRNFPFANKFGQKFLVQDKVGLKNFWSKTKFGLRKLLVQDKVGLGKFSPYFVFSIKP